MCKADPLLLTTAVCFKTLSCILGTFGFFWLSTGMMEAQYYNTVSQTCPSASRMKKIAKILETNTTAFAFKTVVKHDETCRKVLYYGQERCENDYEMRFTLGGFTSLNFPGSPLFDYDKCPQRWIAIPGAILALVSVIIAIVDLVIMAAVLSARPTWGETAYNLNFLLQFVLFLLYLVSGGLLVAFLVTTALSNFPCDKNAYNALSALSFFLVHPSNRQRREALKRELPVVQKIPLTVQNLEFFLQGVGIPAPSKEERDTCAHLSTWVYKDIDVGLGAGFLLLAGIFNLISAIVGAVDKKRDRNQYSMTMKEKVSQNVGEEVEGVVNSMIKRISQ